MGKFDEVRSVSKQSQIGNVIKKKDSSGNDRYFITGNCEDCGEYFEKRKDGHRYKNVCSKCALKRSNAKRKGAVLENRRKGKTKKCKVCQEEFYVSPSRSIASKYCSKKCFSVTQKDKVPKGFIKAIDNSGKKNGRYKDGKRTGERAKQNTPKNKVRKEVIARDGDWCLLCGKPPKGLHLHRVVYGSQGGKYKKSNCVQLCGDDHELIHSNKRVFQPLLEDYLKHATKHQLENEPTEPPFYWHDWIWKMRQAKESKTT